MPIHVRDRGLKNILDRLMNTQHPTTGATGMLVDELVIDDLVREIADGPFRSRGALEKSVAAAKSPEAKLDLAKKGLDADEAALAAP